MYVCVYMYMYVCVCVCVCVCVYIHPLGSMPEGFHGPRANTELVSKFYVALRVFLCNLPSSKTETTSQ
jgi:hypothetical protein